MLSGFELHPRWVPLPTDQLLAVDCSGSRTQSMRQFRTRRQLVAESFLADNLPVVVHYFF